MLERLVKNIGRKITTVALAGTLLLGSGCATYRTISPSLIKPVTSIERPIERPIDYSKLTWQEAIDYVQTPEQAQDYLDRHFLQVFDSSDNLGETFKLNHSDRNGLCLDYATSVAALLSDNNFPALMLAMIDFSGDSHGVFLYRTKDGFSSIGNTPLTGKFPDVGSLVEAYNKKYNWNYKSYFVADLDSTFPNKEWISGDTKLIHKIYLNQSTINLK